MLNKALLPIFVVLTILQPVAASADEKSAPETVTPARAKSAAFYFDFLGYRYDLHRRVISRWEGLVNANRNKLQPCKIQMTYFINTSGVVSTIESTQNGVHASEKSNERKLAEYALALENNEPVPFPETFIKEFPHGFFYQITLVIR